MDEDKYENGKIEIISNNICNKDFFIKIHNEKNEFLEISYQNSNIEINRSNVSYIDEINLPSKINVNVNSVNQIQVLIDRSVVKSL